MEREKNKIAKKGKGSDHRVPDLKFVRMFTFRPMGVYWEDCGQSGACCMGHRKTVTCREFS